MQTSFSVTSLQAGPEAYFRRRTPRRRNTKACSSCRRRKTRCRITSPDRDTCDKCTAKNWKCIFKDRRNPGPRKGSKHNNPQDNMVEDLARSPTEFTSLGRRSTFASTRQQLGNLDAPELEASTQVQPSELNASEAHNVDSVPASFDQVFLDAASAYMCLTSHSMSSESWPISGNEIGEQYLLAQETTGMIEPDWLPASNDEIDPGDFSPVNPHLLPSLTVQSYWAMHNSDLWQHPSSHIARAAPIASTGAAYPPLASGNEVTYVTAGTLAGLHGVDTQTTWPDFPPTLPSSDKTNYLYEAWIPLRLSNETDTIGLDRSFPPVFDNEVDYGLFADARLDFMGTNGHWSQSGSQSQDQSGYGMSYQQWF